MARTLGVCILAIFNGLNALDVQSSTPAWISECMTTPIQTGCTQRPSIQTYGIAWPQISWSATRPVPESFEAWRVYDAYGTPSIQRLFFDARGATFCTLVKNSDFTAVDFGLYRSEIRRVPREDAAIMWQRVMTCLDAEEIHPEYGQSLFEVHYRHVDGGNPSYVHFDGIALSMPNGVLAMHIPHLQLEMLDWTSLRNYCIRYAWTRCLASSTMATPVSSMHEESWASFLNRASTDGYGNEGTKLAARAFVMWNGIIGSLASLDLHATNLVALDPSEAARNEIQNARWIHMLREPFDWTVAEALLNKTGLFEIHVRMHESNPERHRRVLLEHLSSATGPAFQSSFDWISYIISSENPLRLEPYLGSLKRLIENGHSSATQAADVLLTPLPNRPGRHRHGLLLRDISWTSTGAHPVDVALAHLHARFQAPMLFHERRKEDQRLLATSRFLALKKLVSIGLPEGFSREMAAAFRPQWPQEEWEKYDWDILLQ